ncbi:MAG TPA: cytochrome C [bacterium]|nr:cytochrome C [bacterium]
MEHSKHIWRVFILLAVGVVFVVSGRHFLVPASFGKMGHFRFDSIGEYMAKPVMHGNDASCRKCHQDKYDAHEMGKHAAVRCENCHGPLALHVANGEKSADAQVVRSWELCAWCHQPLQARPKDFPQVDFREHLISEDIPVKGTIPPKICFMCHDPHDPLQE